jgi:predicted Zn-dependent protease
MSFESRTREAFRRLAEAVCGNLAAGEALSLNLSAEDQTYVRFNGSKVRQASQIEQRNLVLSFQAEGRKLALSLDMSGEHDSDLTTLRSLLDRARSEVRVLPEDPFLVPMANHGSSEDSHGAKPLDLTELIDRLAQTTAGTEFTGLLAAGPQIRASYNSLGQDHWFSTDGFFLDYSLYTVNQAGENKAVKALYADRNWDWASFERQLGEKRGQLELLTHPSRTLEPGEYRVYFAPSAVDELVGMFSWGAVSYGNWKRGGSALQTFIDGKAEFSEKLTLRENFSLGLTHRFNSIGEVAPAELPVIEQGRLVNLLVSSRSAKEYGVAGNCADPSGWNGEYLRAPEVLGGDLDEAEALKALDTGLYVANLHYLNWSDVHSARITGMTRYACLWVENGEIAAPIRDLRFDDSLYRIFGSELEALTRETYLSPAIDTYHRRALGGSRIPGLLVKRFRFTL